MKYFRELNSKGIGHIELLVVIATIAVIGGIGSYVMLKKSHADVSPVSVCGSGYVLRSTNTVSYGSGPGIVYGPAKTYLLVNKTVKKACFVTISTGSQYGVAKPLKVQAWLEKENPYSSTKISAVSNSGSFKYYAGPVYISYAGYGGQYYDNDSYTWRSTYDFVWSGSTTYKYQSFTTGLHFWGVHTVVNW